MKVETSDFQARFNAWLLRVGKLRVVLAITGVSVILSVLMTWVGNEVFMPDVPVEEWLYISIVVPALISPMVSTLVLSLVYQLAEAKAALQAMAETDPLTGVGNRRYFLKQAAQAIQDAERSRSPLTVVLLDIDRFKEINDSHGHAIGDTALIVVADTCRQGIRAGDILARWGGEEFIVLLPSATLATGCVLAERLRASIAEAVVDGVPREVTVSIGVAELSCGLETLDDVISNADRRMYRAKGAGRNRVEPEAGASIAA